MLNIIIGTVGCGKTEYVHRLLREKAQQGEKDMYLLVPEQFTHESDIGVLEVLGAADACEVSVLSFERLAQRVFDTYGRPHLPQLDDCGRAVFMSLALSELGDSLKVYKRHSDSPALIKSMLELTGELKQCAISPQELSRVSRELPDGVMKQKIQEAALIYETYEALMAQSFFDNSDTLTLLCDILEKTHCFEGRTVALDGFRRFTGQQLQVLERILPQAKEVYVTFCTDRLDISQGEANAFTSIKQTAGRLVELASRCNVRVSVPTLLTDNSLGFSTYSSQALRYLEENLYVIDAEAYEGDAAAVTVCSAASITDECAWVARTIKQLMRTDFCRCRDIAVIFRQEGVYERELKAALKKYDVPTFEDNRQPIANQPLICLVRSVLSVCAGGFDTDALMRYAKTSLSALSTQEWSVLENYVLLWGINGSKWREEWEYNPDGFGTKMDEDKQETLDKINEYRRTLVPPLEALRAQCHDATGAEISEYIYNFLIETGVDERLRELAQALEGSGEGALALEQQQVWELLMELLDQLATAIGERKLGMGKYSELFELTISEKTLGHIPSGFDEVFIGAATRIQRRTSRAVFVVGMNEGQFPLLPTGGGIFTDAQRLELEKRRVELAKNSRTHALDEKFIVYNSLCAARDRLYVSYSCADKAGARLNRSETAVRLETLLPLCNKTTATAEDEMEYIEADEPAFELLSRRWHDSDVLTASLKEYFGARDDYSGKLSAIERAADRKSFELSSAETARELFGENIALSASRIETFESCPFEYFCKYGLKAQPRREARLDFAQSGTVIHYVLQKILGEYGGKGLCSLEGDRCSALVREYLEQYALEFMGGLSDKDKRFTFLLDRLAKTLEVIILRLSTEFSKSAFEPCDFELKIGGAVKSYALGLPNGGSLSIFGYIDRVDKMLADGKTYLRVVDYKTGVKEFNLSDVLNGMNLQMLLYLLALWQDGAEYYGGETVPAGVLYLPARFMPFDAERTDDAQALEEKVIADGKMNGLILDEGTALAGMCAGDGMFVPVKVAKDGTLKGNLINIIELGKLKKRVDELLVNLAVSLHSGDIAARPVFGKGYDKTCEFCDYQSVCAHEKDGEFRYIGFLKHDECLAELGGDDLGTTVDG